MIITIYDTKRIALPSHKQREKKKKKPGDSDTSSSKNIEGTNRDPTIILFDIAGAP